MNVTTTGAIAKVDIIIAADLPSTFFTFNVENGNTMEADSTINAADGTAHFGTYAQNVSSCNLMLSVNVLQEQCYT